MKTLVVVLLLLSASAQATQFSHEPVRVDTIYAIEYSSDLQFEKVNDLTFNMEDSIYFFEITALYQNDYTSKHSLFNQMERVAQLELDIMKRIPGNHAFRVRTWMTENQPEANQLIVVTYAEKGDAEEGFPWLEIIILAVIAMGVLASMVK